MAVERKGYLMHKFSNGRIAVCRILNEYEPSEEEQATKDYLAVATKRVKEEELLEKLNNIR